MYSDYGIQRTRNTVAKKSWPKRMLWLVIFGFAVLTWFTLEYTYDSTEPLISFTAGSVTNSNTEEIPTLFTSKNTKEKTVITPHVKPSAPKQTVIVEDREEVSKLRAGDIGALIGTKFTTTGLPEGTRLILSG